MTAMFAKDVEDQSAMDESIQKLTQTFNEAKLAVLQGSASRSIEDDVVAQADDDGMWWKKPSEDKRAPEPPPDFELPEAFR